MPCSKEGVAEPLLCVEILHLNLCLPRDAGYWSEEGRARDPTSPRCFQRIGRDGVNCPCYPSQQVRIKSVFLHSEIRSVATLVNVI